MNAARDRTAGDPSANTHGNLRHPRRTGLLACLALAGAATIVSGCSGGTPSKQGGPATTTTEVVAPTTKTPANGSPATAARRPSAPLARGVSSSTGSLPFVADANPDVSSVTDGSPVLVSVTKGIHDGYVRYVFLFQHADPDGHQPWKEFARPAWDVRYVPESEAVQDGSGRPVANAGAKAHLMIRFNATMHDLNGDSTIQTSVDRDDPLAFGGEFEGVIRWFYGSDAQRPFRAMYVGDGRVAVDIVV